MPLPKADVIVTQQHKRYFYQPLGAAPENPIFYGGQDGQFLTIENATIPHGDITPINVGDQDQFKQFRQVGREITPPDFATFTVNFLQNHGGIPKQLYDLVNCLSTYYEVTGTCKDPSVLTRDFTDYIKIYSNSEATQTTAGGSAFDADAMVQDDIDFTSLTGVYLVSGISVGEKASAEIASEVVDIVYGSKVECGNCGSNDNGTKLIYSLINSTTASPGIGPAVTYSLDGGVTTTVVAINGATSNDVPKAIDIVGQSLVAVFNDGLAGGYFVATINSITGIPGTWVRVTTGFVSGNAPNDLFVSNPREVYFAAAGGFIYKSESILSGVIVSDAADTTTDNLNRIDGSESTVVAVGDGAAVVYTLNRGDTWALTTNAPASFSIDALQVLDPFRWWVGDSEGDVLWTNNRGETAWTEVALPAALAGALATIQDIIFATDEIGYIVAATSAPTATFFATLNGGRTWEADASINTFPTMDRVNRIAYPKVKNLAVAANNIAFAGLAGNGTDGIIMLGVAPVK